MWKHQLQSMVVESAIRKIRKIEVFKKWKLQSMDCNQDYYHSQYWLQPDYYGNMDTMNYSNNYDWYICSVEKDKKKENFCVCVCVLWFLPQLLPLWGQWYNQVIN